MTIRGLAPTSTESADRSDWLAPVATAGTSTSSRYRRVQIGCGRRPSATRPATRAIPGFTAARWTGMPGCSMGPGVEQRVHQRELIVGAVEVEVGPVLPAVPHGSHRSDVLLYPGGGRRPFHFLPALDVALHLRSQPEDEPTLGGSVQRPRGHGRDGGTVGKGHRHRRGQFDPAVVAAASAMTMCGSSFLSVRTSPSNPGSSTRRAASGTAVTSSLSSLARRPGSTVPSGRWVSTCNVGAP